MLAAVVRVNYRMLSLFSCEIMLGGSEKSWLWY